MRVIALLLLIALPCQAQVKHIEQGVPAPYAGYLFSPDAEEDARLAVDKLDNCEQQKAILAKSNVLLTTTIGYYDERISLYQKQLDVVTEQNIRYKDGEFLKNAVFFLGGALVTGVMAYGLSKTVR